jgi:hypothetical protein
MNYKHYATDFNLAKEPIAECLKEGTLKLILGAGISMDFGLPNWPDLIFKCLNALLSEKGENLIERKDFDENFSKNEKKLNQYDNEPTYSQIVRDSLYSEVPPNLEDLLLQGAPGLLAIAALCTGTTRGRVRHIFTLNFDDILEQYLSLLGLRVNSGSSFTRGNYNSDIRIDHLHGYLPRNEDNLSKIVFSPRSYTERYAETRGFDDWFINQWVGSKLLLIGLSGSDQLLQTNAIRHKNLLNNDEIHGYALLTPHAYEDNHLDLVSHGICPIKIPAHEIPKFLLSCCQLASEL